MPRLEILDERQAEIGVDWRIASGSSSITPQAPGAAPGRRALSSWFCSSWCRPGCRGLSGSEVSLGIVVRGCFGYLRSVFWGLAAGFSRRLPALARPGAAAGSMRVALDRGGRLQARGAITSRTATCSRRHLAVAPHRAAGAPQTRTAR